VHPLAIVNKQPLHKEFYQKTARLMNRMKVLQQIKKLYEREKEIERATKREYFIKRQPVNER